MKYLQKAKRLIRSFLVRVKAKIQREIEFRKHRKKLDLIKAEFNSKDLPARAIALPFNHVITIRNAHALYKSFQSIGQNCVLIDVSGGELLAAAKKNGTYNPDYNYLVCDFDFIDLAAQFDELNIYSPSISDITTFSEICRDFYPRLKSELELIDIKSEESFLILAYESYEDFFDKEAFKLSPRLLKSGFSEVTARYLLANLMSRIKGGETSQLRALGQAWALNKKYILAAQEHEVKSRQFEHIISDHKFSRAIHFCGPYTLSGVLLKYAFHNAGLECTLFHDAFMPPEQMKILNNSLSSFQCDRLQTDILYEGRSDQPAYDLNIEAEDITLRYPVRTWASYDFLGLPQKCLWASWMDYPKETVGVKNTAIAKKFVRALNVNERVKVIGNPLLESGSVLPPEIDEDRPTLLVSVAPDIFSSVRFESTKYLTSMDAYLEELKRIISVYSATANVVIALHPRLTADSPYYNLMAGLGDIATSPTGHLLPHADLFLTYVGSVMNFDADELNIPMLALSLYDDAKSYSQNEYQFDEMHMIETSKDMQKWLQKSTPLKRRNNKNIPSLGATARELMAFWSSSDY